MEQKIVYFEEEGSANTDETIRIAKQRADELGIKAIIVASNRGGTALKAIEAFNGIKVVVVTHSTGFRDPDTQEFTDEMRASLESQGASILTTGHTFMGINRAITRKHKMVGPEDIISDVFRCFGHGTKVGVEIAMMAADSGLVSCSEDVITIGGSHGGADTALILKPVNSQRFFDLKVKEILCKPHF